MLKKLAALSLSLMLCLSALLSQAGAMDAPGGDTGIAPCMAESQDILGNHAGGAGGADNGNIPNDAKWPGTGGYYLPKP